MFYVPVNVLLCDISGQKPITIDIDSNFM